MFQFFDSVIGYIETLWGFVVSFFSSLSFAIEVTQFSLALPFSLVGILPTIFGAAISIFLAVYLVKFLLGR